MENEIELQKFKAKKQRLLVLSLVLDAVGMFTYAVPMLAEIGDVLYAPIYGLAIFFMYKKNVAPALIGGLGGFAEEILPATDFIPSATIMWIYTYFISSSKTPPKSNDKDS